MTSGHQVCRALLLQSDTDHLTLLVLALVRGMWLWSGLMHWTLPQMRHWISSGLGRPHTDPGLLTNESAS